MSWFGTRSSSLASRPRHSHRRSIALEFLEARDCPAAPQIMMFSSTIVQGQTVQLSGMVMDENPGSVSINFSGAASGTTTSNALGLFQFQTTASQLGTIYAQASDNQALTSQVAESILSAPPPTLTVNLTQQAGRMVTLSGQVTAGALANLTVCFTGQVAATTTTSSTGAFTYTGQASALGAITAKVTDIWGQQSAGMQVQVTSNAPSVTMTVMQGANRAVYIQGRVTDESPGGINVTLSGVVSATVTTTSTGMFTYSGTASSLGAITASAVDCWGLTGSASATLTNAAPSIVNFQAVSVINNTWTIEGRVIDEFASGLIVHLTSTIAALNGVDMTVDSSGWFSYTVQLQPGDTGDLSAITTDWWGVQSTTANTSIS